MYDTYKHWYIITHGSHYYIHVHSVRPFHICVHVCKCLQCFSPLVSLSISTVTPVDPPIVASTVVE